MTSWIGWKYGESKFKLRKRIPKKKKPVKPEELNIERKRRERDYLK